MNLHGWRHRPPTIDGGAATETPHYVTGHACHWCRIIWAGSSMHTTNILHISSSVECFYAARCVTTAGCQPLHTNAPHDSRANAYALISRQQINYGKCARAQLCHQPLLVTLATIVEQDVLCRSLSSFNLDKKRVPLAACGGTPFGTSSKI